MKFVFQILITICKIWCLRIFRDFADKILILWFSSQPVRCCTTADSFFFLVWWAIYWNVDEFELFNVLHHSGTGIWCFSSYLSGQLVCYFDSSRCAKTSFVISNTFHGADSVSFSLSASTLAITKIATFPMNGNVR